MKRLIPFVVLLTVLVACGGSEPPTPSPTPVPTVVVVPTDVPMPAATPEPPKPNPCTFTGGVGMTGKVWQGDCAVSGTCWDNHNGTFSGSKCVTK